MLASQLVFAEFGEVPGGHGWQDPHAVFTSFAQQPTAIGVEATGVGATGVGATGVDATGVGATGAPDLMHQSQKKSLKHLPLV